MRELCKPFDTQRLTSVLQPVVGIPGFWLRALNSQPGVASSITARDSGCLESLQDIQIEHKKGSVTFKFHFGPNEFFSNKVMCAAWRVEQRPSCF